MYDHDYCGRGIYMITLAVEGRLPLLCAVSGTPEAPLVIPTAVGVAVCRELEHICEYYPAVRVLAKQLMPDHFHFILFVTERMALPLGRVINGFKAGCRRAMRELAAEAEGAAGAAAAAAAPAPASAPQSGTARDTAATTAATAAPAPQSGTARDTAAGTAAPAAAPAPQSGTARDTAATAAATAAATVAATVAATSAATTAAGVGCGAALQPRGTGAQPRGTGAQPSGTAAQPRGTAAQPRSTAARQGTAGVLWERGYNDRVLYGRGQLQTMMDYIHENPRRLLVRRGSRQYFRHGEVTIGGTRLYAFGNMELLGAGERIAVRCSRSMDGTAIDGLCRELQARGREGAVLVSPFISGGERQVEKMAIASSIPIIRIESDGFSPLFKPPGMLFDVCARGRLLLLSPFTYSTATTKLTREVCNRLNDIAQQVCKKKG